MEQVAVYAVGVGKMKVKGQTPLFYQGRVYRGMLRSDRFIGNSTDSKQCLLWRLMQNHTDYWTIATSVVWRVDEVVIPLSSGMTDLARELPLIFKSSAIEERGLLYVKVIKRKGRWTMKVREKGSLWLFNMLYRWYGTSYEGCIADTFLAGFVEKYCD